MSKATATILFVWAGLLIGVSFVATPAKFLAPGLPLAQALDVGRWTFHVLAWIEWALVAVVALLLALTWRSGGVRIGLAAGLVAVAATVLAAESLVLRPLLDARVVRIIAGVECAAEPLAQRLYRARGIAAGADSCGRYPDDPPAPTRSIMSSIRRQLPA